MNTCMFPEFPGMRLSVVVTLYVLMLFGRNLASNLNTNNGFDQTGKDWGGGGGGGALKVVITPFG